MSTELRQKAKFLGHIKTEEKTAKEPKVPFSEEIQLPAEFLENFQKRTLRARMVTLAKSACLHCFETIREVAETREVIK